MRLPNSTAAASQSLPELISKYLNYLIFIESASFHTIRSYAVDLEQAFSLRKDGRFAPSEESGPWTYQISDQKEGPRLPLFEPEQLLAQAREAQGQWRHLSPATRNRKSSCLKSFLGWLFREGLIDKDLASQVVGPKVPVRLPHFISVDEITALIKNLQARLAAAATVEARDRLLEERALILLLYGGGLRVSEACGVRWSDFREGVCRIKGKGGKERLVALPETVAHAIEACPRTGEYLFGEKPMNPRKAYAIVRTAGTHADLVRPLHPHALRHSYATHLLASGASLRTLQELLGHGSLLATQKYTHVTVDQLARTLEERHPLAKKKL